jgi:amino acid adenylation domain-containing protein/non-ribosomal peptide synthase protein (TIGR01720 family)
VKLSILFDKLGKRGIRLWSEGDKLKAFLPKDVKLEPGEKELIDGKKDEIIAILKRNRIFTAEDSAAREILEGLNEGGAWELSFAQERLWFIEHLEGGSSAYNIPMVHDLGADADLDAFKKSVQDIAMRHEVLRTVFRRDDDGRDFQYVLPSAPPIEQERLTEVELPEKLKGWLARVFDLVREGPLKAGLFITEKSAYSVIVVHHIAFDGWSAEIFDRELEALYLHHREGKEAQLQRLDIQYRDFALWQRARLAGQELERQKAYWKNALQGCETLELPTDRARPARVDYQGGNVRFELSAELSGKLTGMAGSMGVTLYTVLLSTFYVLLNKYTGQSSLVVGTSEANREHRELENVIGFFVNSMALKADIAPTMTFSALVESVHRLLMESQQYRELPFEKVVEALEAEKDLSRHPVFQVMFGLQSFGGNRERLFRPVPIDDWYEPAKFDLSLFIDGQGAALKGVFNYAASLFDQQTVERMKGHYLRVLDQVAASPGIPIRDITILTGGELEQIVYRWNETDAPYHRDSTIVSLFEEQVEKTPNLTAVICRKEKLTYRDLNRRANQLAHIIRRDYRDFTGSDVKGDTLIGVYIERSIDMIVAVLGILKAGAAYVPFDSADPTERLRFKINNCGCRMVLTRSESVKDLVFLIETDTAPLSLDTYGDELCRAQVGNPARINRPEDLAYIIYTSGSTGRPKGVMLEHRSVLNYVENYRTSTAPGHKIFDLSSSLSFDLTVTTTLAPLLTGSTIAIYPGSLKDIDEYARHLDRHGVSFIKTVPSLLYLLLGHSRHASLKEIFVGGEKLNRDLLTNTEGLSIYDEYGPTEATVGTTLSTVAPLCQPGIGKPYHNYRVYILDNTGAPVPIGVTGEIYIGGEGLARGYLRRPELTSERFVDNPFATAAETAEGRNLRMYRTGDLARWRPDGNIEYTGRNDDQIKIRGFRIELGEIEERLSEHRSVSQCAVLCRELNGNKYLAAYYVTKEQVSADALRAHLAALLPEYMIPSFFTRLEAMPLTVNGKVDRKALPEPDWKGDEQQYTAPRNDIEEMLCRIWSKELGIEKIGITDDFFKMGGNSILAIRLSHRMTKALEREIPVASIFELKTVKNISEEMVRFRRQVNIEPCGSDEAVLSFAQERLYFIEEYEGGSSAYNIPLLYELDGETDIDALKKAIASIVMRQEILRTVFVRNDSGEVRQKVCAEPPYIREREISESDFERSVAEDINTVFDLHNECPFRTVLYRTEKKRRLLFIIHHIAFDGWSTDIFLSELEQLYRHHRDGSAAALPRLEIQYRDFAVWQRAYLSGERLEGELEYWRKALADFKTLEFPADLPRPAEVQYGGDYLTFELDSELSDRLRAAVNEYGTTPYSLFLAAFYILLNRYSGQDDIIIGTPTANRQYRQLEDLVGFFVNSTVMRCVFTPDLDIRGLIEHTAAAQAAMQMHQDMPFEKLTELLHLEKDPSRHPLFQIMFSVQSFGDSDLTGKLRFMKPLDCSGLYKVSKFDLSLFISDSGKNITGGFNYSTGLFEKARIAQLSRHYQNILRQIASGENALIRDIPLLSSAERDMIIRDWNETGASYPRESTIAEIFEAQADKNPDRKAVLFDNESLTYRELNERANRLAHTLRRDFRELTGTEIKGDTLIGIYMERSLEQITAVLGILKSGAAYVPFDRADPQARLRFKINDSGARMTVTSSRCIGDLVFLTEKDALPLSIDEYRDELEKAPCSNPGRVSGSRDLAYVIYTSGSTGNPKGVMIEQYGVVNLAFSHRKSLEITGDSRILHFAPLSFDASVSTLFCALLNGVTLCMCTDEMRNDAAKLSAFIAGSKISHIDIPAKLLEILPKDLDCTSLRSIITAGEICDSRTMEYWGGRIKLINAYGPTESTVCATFAAYAPGRSNVNIGKPISNKKVYVLGSNLSPVPAGVPGELYIGGDGLARCYLNQPDMTAARFVKNPFLHESDQTAERRMYRTGDVARWTRDGDLEFLGRNDDQVKIRGYRIELAEVEHKLSACPGIAMCAVTACQRDLGRHLCAYYTVSGKTSADEIRAYLATELPDYMIPSFYMELETFPLSASGKVDRKALPEPRAEAGGSSYVPPADELQQKICEIFSGLLGVEKIGINDDFFRLGGDSIMSIQLSSSLRNAGLDCAVKDIFKNPTVLKLSEHIAAHREQKAPVIAEQGVLEGEFDLLPIQRWFFEHVTSGQFKARNHWNQSFMVKVPELDTELLARCVQSLALHHDMLRSVFSADRQQYRREIAVPELKILDRGGLTDDGLQDALTGWQSGFDIDRGSLWQIGYLKGFQDGSARLFFALHHLIADAVSWRILIEDMRRLYEGEQLKEKTSSYRQWVNAVKHYPEQHPDERHYWEAAVRALPDYSPHREEGAKPVKRELRLGRELTGQLLREANRAYLTQVNDLLLTAFAFALKDWHGGDTQGVTVEGHGREDIDPAIDHSHTLGWFTTVCPVKLNVPDDPGRAIVSVKQALRQIPRRGIGWGAFCCSSHREGPGRLCNNLRLPPVTFNYLGQLDSGEAGRLWQFVNEPSGVSIDPSNPDLSLIAVNGIAADGQMVFSVVTRLDEEATDRLVRRFEESLQQIASHCLEVSRKGGLPGYNVEDFEYIPALLLNKNGRSKRLAIIIHPDSGYEAYMATLYPALSSDIRVILVDNFYKKVYLRDGVLMEKYHFSEFSGLADYYVKLLLDGHGELIRESECCLIGYSFGSPIAIEMDRLFRERGIPMSSLYLIDPLIPHLLRISRELDCFEWYRDYVPARTATPVVHFRCTEPDPELPGYAEYFVNPRESSLSPIAENLEEINIRCRHTAILTEPGFLKAFGERANRELVLPSGERQVSEEIADLAVESSIRDIVRTAVEMDDRAVVDGDANLFQLGCSSIQCLSVLGMVNERFRLDLALSDMIGSFTVKGIAALVAKAEKAGRDVERWKPVEFASPEQQADALYFFPGLIGSVGSYSQICRRLSERLRVVFMEPKGMYGTMVPFAGYEEAIHAYADEIAARSGAGSRIFLTGHSIGSIHSIDTALLLEERGFTDVRLINIDGFLHGIRDIRESLHTDNLDEALLSAVRIFFERGRDLEHPGESSSGDPLQQIASILFPQGRVSRDYALRVALGYRNIWHQQLGEMLSYREPSGKFGGLSLLFLTGEPGEEARENILQSCRSRCLREPKAVGIAGDHLSCITRHDIVEEICARIGEWVESDATIQV